MKNTEYTLSLINIEFMELSEKLMAHVKLCQRMCMRFWPRAVSHKVGSMVTRGMIN